MTNSRTLAVWAQVAAHAAAHGERPSVADVCAVAVSSAQLAGAWVVAACGGDADFVMGVTGLVSEQLAELQLTMGEGPCHDVLASAAPVLPPTWVMRSPSGGGRRSPRRHAGSAPGLFSRSR